MRTALVDAMSAQNIWSLNFDEPSTNLPAAQDEIAARLAHILALSLNASADERRKTATTSNPDAYLEYLQGARVGRLVSFGRICSGPVSHYARALEIDPSFSSALSGLAWARIPDAGVSRQQLNREGLDRHTERGFAWNYRKPWHSTIETPMH